ncbi:protein FAR1-RELATED SEQUENCE 9-like [Fagus crenata]
MSFSCEQEAHKFYQKYATEMGFKVRKGKVQRLSNGSLKKRYFFCSQEGFRSKKQPTKKTTYTRKETRTGCNAKIQITFENERFLISEFISDHNHDLQGSTQRHYIDPNSNTSKNRKSEAMTLLEYVQKYEKAAEQQRREELHEDFCCNASEPMLILGSPMEKQAANIYTRTMFEIFQNELIRIMSWSVPLRCIKKMGTTFTFKVTEGEKIENIVQFNRLDSTVTCSCRMFETIGILCSCSKGGQSMPRMGVVEDDNCEEIGDKNDSSLSSSKRKLMHKALNFITKSVAVEKSQKIAERYLDIALKEVEDVLKEGSECLDTKAPEIYVHKKSGVAGPIKETYHDQEETSKRRME